MENKKQKTVKSTLQKKFGVSENIYTKKYFNKENSFSKEDTFDSNRERRPFREERKDAKPFAKRDSFDRRRSFGNKSDRRFSSRKVFDENSKPIYRQRPEKKPVPDFETQKEESVLEQNLQFVNESTSESVPTWFKKVIALTTEKGREREGNFLGEGIHVVQELVSNHRDQVIAVYYAESFQDKDFIESIRKTGVTVHDISNELMEKASTTVTSQGIFAVCRMASSRPDYETSRSVLTLVDAVQDPGNLGTLFRTSLGFSLGGMVLGKGTVSPFNPKVVRGSSGTFLNVPFENDIDLIEKINFLHQKGYTVIATDLHAKQTLQDIPKNKLRKVAFLVGNEGAGTNAYLIELADETVKIPMSNRLESLNVAVAHGILSYEIASIQKDI